MTHTRTDLLDNAVSLLRELVSIPTVNPPGTNYREMSEFLRSKLEDIGFHVKVIEIPEEYLDIHYPYTPQHKGYPRYIILGKYGEGEPRIHFNSHYDVVPPGSGWEGNPFELRVNGEKLIGRGTSDMKGGIAALITALQSVIKDGTLRGTVEVAFVPDEESGGIGTKYLVEKVGIRPKYVIITEPTSSKRLAIGHKGMVRGLITVIGKQAHASRPWLGINAFEKACSIVAKALPRIRNQLRRVRSKYPFTSIEAAFSTVSFGGYAKSSVMKDNVIPGEFTFSYDLRVIPETPNDEALAKVINALTAEARKEGIRIKASKLVDIPAAATPPDSPLINFVKHIAKEALGSEPEIFVNTGRYDLVFYRIQRADVVVYGPGVPGQPHSINEYTTKAEILAFIKVYSSILRRVNELI